MNVFIFFLFLHFVVILLGQAFTWFVMRRNPELVLVELQKRRNILLEEKYVQDSDIELLDIAIDATQKRLKEVS